MFKNLFFLAVSLFMVIKGSIYATEYAMRLAKNLHLSKYIVGFIIVTVISILPETSIAIKSALSGIPSFGLGTLFGSNVADLTLVFTLVIAITNSNIKIENKIIKNNIVYPFLLLVPLILGLNGFYSRVEGAVLIITGAAFYFLAFKNGSHNPNIKTKPKDSLKNASLLIASMALLLVSAHFTVESAVSLAHDLGVAPVLIGILVVGLGTTMPELFFSIQAVKKNSDSLAVGDVLGTVLADATIVVGLIALISPFSFPIKIIYVTGAFMLAAALLVTFFMRTDKTLSKKEGLLLLLFWIAFVLTEYYIIN